MSSVVMHNVCFQLAAHMCFPQSQVRYHGGGVWDQIAHSTLVLICG